MRYLLLFLLLALQSSVFGYSTNDQLKNAAQKTLISVKSDLKVRSFLDFKYQGQYEDTETGLYYNRHRYYDPNSGVYISQDPIGLASGEANFYSYVRDVNSHVDYFGLASKCSKSFKIKGLVGNRQLRSLTHNEIFNSFKKAGINLTSHAVKRLKDLRTKKLGFATPNDIMKIFNKGQKEVTERAIEQSHAGLTAVISKQTGKIITFTP